MGLQRPSSRAASLPPYPHPQPFPTGKGADEDRGDVSAFGHYFAFSAFRENSNPCIEACFKVQERPGRLAADSGASVRIELSVACGNTIENSLTPQPRMSLALVEPGSPSCLISLSGRPWSYTKTIGTDSGSVGIKIKAAAEQIAETATPLAKAMSRPRLTPTSPQTARTDRSYPSAPGSPRDDTAPRTRACL